MERDPRVRETLAVIGTDPYVVMALGEAELAKGRRP